MTARRTPPSPPPRQADLPPDKAHALLSKQLESLQKLKGRDCDEAAQDKDGWEHFTEELLIRAFGENHLIHTQFRYAKNTGSHTMRVDSFFGGGGGNYYHQEDQDNYNKQIASMETALKSALEMLAVDMPEPEIKGTYGPNEQYEFYADVTKILSTTKNEVFIIDPYIDIQMFNLYAKAFDRRVKFRLATNWAMVKDQNGVFAAAKLYAAGGNFEFRNSKEIHDRVLFADHRVFVSGQSLKDAATRKGTYLGEHDEHLMRRLYEDVWKNATPLL